MKESVFQANLIRKLKVIFPECLILKNDPTYIQGIPDLLILYKSLWAVLECKASSKARHRPNQDYYISLLDSMGFASFISPQNETEVLEKLKLYFGKELRDV